MKHVQHVRGKWIVRVTVPEELRGIIGKRELVETDLPADAKARERKALGIINSFYAQIDDARDALAAGKPTLATAAKEHYRAELAADDMGRTTAGSESLAFSRSIYARNLRLLAAGKLDRDEAEALIGYAADALAARERLPDAPRQDVLRILAEVQLEALERFEERDLGQVKLTPPSHPLLNVPDPAPQKPQDGNAAAGLTLGEALTAFHRERTAGGSSLASATMEEHKVAVRMFEEFKGGSVAVRGITKQDVIAYKQALLATPTRYTMRFPGLTLPQAIRANAKREQPYETLNPQTINMKWLSHLSSILQWASNNGFMEHNPAKGIRVDTGSKVHKQPSRLPFDAREMKLIFGDPTFADPAKYGTRQWAVLLALYTGARSSSEIARLRISDVYSEQDTLVFNLSGASKNAHSKRLVPVHDDLVKLGLLDYLTKQQAAGETRLFPDWEPEDRVNRWFLRTFLPKVGIDAKEKVFHSFRHNLKTELVRTGCPKELHDLITGHEDQSVAAVYVHDTPIRRMATALNRVKFSLPIRALQPA